MVAPNERLKDSTIIIRSSNSAMANLPGAIVLPDGKAPVSLGSGTVTSLLSSGGTALIYEIWNPELEVTRAVKLLHPDHTTESEERFQTEIKISAKLHHPNIVEIYSVGKWNGLPYIEMERIQGVTLEQLIHEHGVLPTNVVTSIGIMVGRALNYAHNQIYVIRGKEYHGIIHRDLKPSNIMIARDGTVKLMDFGIAKPVNASSHTMEGVVMGTMQYLSPEQLNQQEVDVRSDIYSLGLVLYEALTGHKVFPEQNLAKLVTDTLNNNYIPLDSYTTKIPAKLRALIHRCMLYDKEKRVQNILVFLRTLGALHKKSCQQVPEVVMKKYMAGSQEPRTRTIVAIKKHHMNPVPLIILILAILSIGLAAGFMYTKRELLKKSAITFLVDIARKVQPPVPVEKITSSQDTDLKKNGVSDTKNQLDQTITLIEENFPAAPKPVSSSARVKKRVSSVSPLDALKAKLIMEYKTGDILTLIVNETDARRYATAEKLIPALSSAVAASPKALIYQMRIYKGTRSTRKLTELLETKSVNDGEWFLEKSLIAIRSNNTATALEFLERAGQAPVAYVETETFRKDLAYQTAVCKTELFNATPSAQTQKAAMEAWFIVKSQMRSDPRHAYFAMANEEIRRINASLK